MGVSAFAFVEGAMNRLKERKQEKQATDAAAAKALAKEDQIRLQYKLAGENQIAGIDQQWLLEQKKEELKKKKKIITIGDEPITFGGTQILKGDDPFNLPIPSDDGAGFQGWNNLATELTDGQKDKFEQWLQTGGEQQDAFLTNYTKGLRMFKKETSPVGKNEFNPASVENLIRPGIPSLDKLIDNAFFTPQFKELRDLRKNNVVAYKDGDKYYIGTPKDAENISTDLVPVRPEIFMSKTNISEYGNAVDYLNGPKEIAPYKYEGVLLANEAFKTNGNPMPHYYNMISAKNNPNYIRKTNNSGRDEEYNKNRGNVGNHVLANSILDSSFFSFMDYDGLAYEGAPHTSGYLKNFRTNRANDVDLSNKFLTKWGGSLELLGTLIDIKDMGGFVAPGGSIADRFGNFLIDFIDVNEPAAVNQTTTQAFLGLITEADFGEVFNKSVAQVGQSVDDIYGKTSDKNYTRARLNRIFGNDVLNKTSFTAKELEDGEAFLKANQDIFVKLRTGKVLSAEERYNATLFSMAYTYASYIQGGKGGTRTVSDADILFAIKMLGGNTNIGSSTNLKNEVRTLGEKAKVLVDRGREIIQEAIPSNMVMNPISSSHYPEKNYNLQTRYMVNAPKDVILDSLYIVGGEKLQNQYYQFESSYEGSYGDFEGEDLNAEIIRRMVEEDNFFSNFTGGAELFIGAYADTTEDINTYKGDTGIVDEAKIIADNLDLILENDDKFDKTQIEKVQAMREKLIPYVGN